MPSPHGAWGHGSSSRLNQFGSQISTTIPTLGRAFALVLGIEFRETEHLSH